MEEVFTQESMLLMYTALEISWNTVPLTGKLTNECEWHVCCECVLASKFLALTCTRRRAPRVRSSTHEHLQRRTWLLKTWWQICNWLKAYHVRSYIFDCLSSLKKLTKTHQKVLCICACKCSRLCVGVLDSTWKIWRVRSLSTPSNSFTASPCSTNSPTFIKKYHKQANCWLDLAIIWLPVQ